MDSRRDFIKKAAMLSGAAGLSGMLPAAIQKAMAINPATGSTYLDAEHIVILMQENRSFDHCFGTLRGVRGYNDPRAITLPNKNLVWLQSNEKGETYAPFHLDIKNSKATWMHSLPHSWANQVNARNDGKFDKWLDEKKSDTKAYENMPLTLGHYTRQDIPFYYTLADAFTVCDQHFCSALTGTGPNRFFFWTGTIREQPDENSRAEVWNEDADFNTQKWVTFPERLEDNGISWKCYQNEISADVGLDDDETDWLGNYTDNPLEYFVQYNSLLYDKHLAFLHKQAEELPGKISDLQKKLDALPIGDEQIIHLKKRLKECKGNLEDVNKELANSKPGQFEQLSNRDKNLHYKAFTTNSKDPDYHTLTTLTYDDNGTQRELKVPKGDPFYQFREDVKTGELPTVSWLVAPENFSDHPSAPWYGAWYVSEIMDILTQDPEVWKKTIFILTYDENDGYFDHVPPFVAPRTDKPGTGTVSNGIDTSVEFVTRAQELDRKGFPEEYDRESPVGLGYRVPMIIASPWSRGGWVNSEVFDHTSTLQFLERFLTHKTGKNIQENNISEWRRATCGNLTSVFRPYHGEKLPGPAFLAKNAFIESIHKAKFKNLPDGFKRLSDDEIAQTNKNPHSSPYLPQQEIGIKPSSALPYQLYANGKLSDDKKSFQIKFEAGNAIFGKNAAGSPFNVYAPGKYLAEDARTWAYAVKPGDNLTGEWPLQDFENGEYHLRVYGPNGFFREFAGDRDNPGIDIFCFYQGEDNKKLSGNICIEIKSRDVQNTHTLEIIDNAYKTKKLTTDVPSNWNDILVLGLEKSHNWYDFTARIKGNSKFMCRCAGRVETGKHSFSDPFMGRVVE